MLLTRQSGALTLSLMSVLPIPPHTHWVDDVRAGGRALRISAHPEAGVVLVSLWRDARCVGTAQFVASEVAELIAGLSDGLAELARAGSPQTSAASEPYDLLEERLADLETRLSALESR